MISRRRQAANALWGALFLYSAFVNLNDPDPLMWVPIYLAGSAMCVMDATGRLSRWTAIAMAVLYLGAAGLVALGGIGAESHPMKGFPQVGIFVEEVVRESLGLGLIGVWAVVLAWRNRVPEADASP